MPVTLVRMPIVNIAITLKITSCRFSFLFVDFRFFESHFFKKNLVKFGKISLVYQFLDPMVLLDRKVPLLAQNIIWLLSLLLWAIFLSNFFPNKIDNVPSEST